MTKEDQTQQPVSGAMTDEQIKFRFFKELTAEQRLAVFKVFGVYPEGCTERLNHGIESRLLSAILSRAQDAQAVRNAALEEAAQFCSKNAGAMRSLADEIRALQSAAAQPVERPDAVKLPPLPKPALYRWKHAEDGSYVYDTRPAYGGTKGFFTEKQVKAYTFAAIAANQPQHTEGGK